MTREPRPRLLFPEDAALEGQPSRQVLGPFVTMKEIARALGRRRRLWISLALIGLLLGLAYRVLLPTYEATSTLVLQHNPADNPQVDMANDAALLETPAVAQAAIDRLHLRTTPQLFMKDYVDLAVSDQILQVTVSASTEKAALARTNALDAAFLAVRTRLFDAQNASTVRALDREVNGLQRQVTTLAGQIGTAKSNGQSVLASTLEAEQSSDIAEIASLQTTISTDNQTTAAITSSSGVLTVAQPVKSSVKKKLITDGATGLVAGLTLGWIIIITSALLFEGPRRRADIAAALRAPVGLSVPRARGPRRAWRLRLRYYLSRPPSAGLRAGDYLTGLLRGRSERLAVVAADDEALPILSAVLAGCFLSDAGYGVTLVDCSEGHELARLFGLKRAGDLQVPLPPGFLHRRGKGRKAQGRLLWPGDEDAVASDLSALESGEETAPEDKGATLVYVTLDPAKGGAKLTPWADSSVVFVTAGRSSESRLLSLQEMLRESSVSIRSLVVVGPDEKDETLGRIALDQPLPEPLALEVASEGSTVS